jgi:hypothetical protein
MRGFIFAISLCAGSVAGAFAEAAEQSSPLVITNVTLIDDTGAAPQPHMNVRIESGHLVEIARASAKTAAGDVKTGLANFLRVTLSGLGDHRERQTRGPHPARSGSACPYSQH